MLTHDKLLMHLRGVPSDRALFESAQRAVEMLQAAPDTTTIRPFHSVDRTRYTTILATRAKRWEEKQRDRTIHGIPATLQALRSGDNGILLGAAETPHGLIDVILSEQAELIGCIVYEGLTAG